MIKKLFSTETRPNAFFRHIDWTAFWSATAVSFLVYFFTLGPSVGLEDSGELTTAADHLGVPHPPGYPFWTLCCWIFCRLFSWVTYMGQPTPAWAVALFSAVAGAFAAGCTAMLICRSGSDMLDSMDSDATGRVPPADAARRHALMGFAGGLGGSLVFAFSPVEWSQSTIVEIYSLNALFLMAVFLLSYRWMRKPSDKILWLTAFVFGLGLTNYQVLLLAAVPLVLIILLRNIRLFRDLLLILIPVGLTVQVLKVGGMGRASAMMGADVINKFEPVLLAESCPKDVLLWIAFGLVVAAPVLGMVLSAITKKRQVALSGALGLGFAGIALIALANTVFADTPVEVESLEQLVQLLKSGDCPCTWAEHPDFAPLIQPATYTWIALFLAASCVLSLGASFAPSDAHLADRRVWTWLVSAGLCALVACTIAVRLPAADNGGYSGEAFSWTFNTVCLVVGLSLLLLLALLTPRQRGLAFAIPVAAVQGTVFILLYKGAMNGLTHPTTWWFFWPCIWNFIMLGLAIVSLPNGRSIGLAMLFAEIGVSFYAYMPVVSDLRNPPMNWGYPRTWEGFKHAITRGQYEAINIRDLLSAVLSADGFSRFCEQMGFYFEDLRRQFTLIAAALALIPFALWKGVIKTKQKMFSVPAAHIAVGLYIVTATLVVIFSELFDGEVPGRLDKYLLLVMMLVAFVGVGTMFVRQTLVVIRQMRKKEFAANGNAPVHVRFLADDITQQWLIVVGSCFAIMSFILVALANIKGDVQDWFIQKVKFISSHGMFSLWIGYGIIVGLIVANRLFARLWPERAKLRHRLFCVTCVLGTLVAAIPVYENYTNDSLVFKMGAAEQNGHTFGWQFGNYQLRGANAIREELAPDEEPLPNPLWPKEMEPSAVFFGGTDPGRFVPTYMIYSANVRPDVYLITQNALADDTYMSVERDLYGDEIWIPSKDDSAEAFNIYVNEVQSGKRRANGDLVIENGRVQVTGALGVMEINGILAKMMFDHERTRRAFYVEESYAIPWMYDYLTPHGLIMKINAESNSMNDALIRNDMEFWDWFSRRLLKDPAFRRDFVAQKSFSKLRTAIAGLYSRRNLSCALQAFQEAVALSPAHPEATFRYIHEALLHNGKWDAALDILAYLGRVDPNSDRIKDKEEDNEKTKGILSHVRAMRDVPVTLNTILRRHWKQETPPPDVTRAPFPDDVRKQLSDSEIDEIAEARLDYAEANLHVGQLNDAYRSVMIFRTHPAHAKSFNRLWRATKVMQGLSHDPGCAATCADLATEALNAIKDEICRFSVRNRIVNIFDTAFQTYKSALDKNAAKCPEHIRTFLHAKAAEQKSKCIKAIEDATEFLDQKKPGKRNKDEKGMDGEMFNAALRYVRTLEHFKGTDEEENANLENVENHVVDKVLATASPAQILSLAEEILAANVNTDRRNVCAKNVGQKLLDPLAGRSGTDRYKLSEFYQVCSRWTRWWADEPTLATDFAEKALSCFAEFAKGMDSTHFYLKLADMYDAATLLMPNDKQRLSARKEEARRNAVRACLKQACRCILSAQPDLEAANSWLKEADQINPDYAREMSILKFLNLK